MDENFHSHVINSGVSGTLRALFEGLRETPGIFTEYKYRKEDVNRVAQYLVCRNYGKACLELSYMCWGVINYEAHQQQKSPLVDFFWLNENISPARLKAAFALADKPSTVVVLGPHNLSMQLAKPFEITLSRVRLLATLLEFIVSVNPALIQYIEASLHNAQEAAIKSLSSELQKHIYQFLTKHIDAAQTQRRYRYVANWLDHQAEQQGVSDEGVFAFWCHASTDDNSPGHKLYATALLDIIATDQALIQAQLLFEAQHGSSIGYDSELGELSPESIHQSVFEEADSQSELAFLADLPKCLTKQQWELVQPLVQGQAYFRRLPWSFVRLAVMGQWQAKLVQAKRQSLALVQQKMREPIEYNYQDYVQSLKQQPLLYRSVLLAITHIFYTLQDPRFMGILFSLLPPDTVATVKETLLSKITNNIDAVFALTQQTCEQLPEGRELIQQAAAAFKGNNKQGFKSLPAGEELERYQLGAEGVQRCQQLIKQFVQALNVTDSRAIEQNFDSDVSIFKQVFEHLYLSKPKHE